jgi:dolichol-phosphate mannosyltransferase
MVVAALLTQNLLIAIPALVLLAVRLMFQIVLRPNYERPGWTYWLAPLADGAAVLRLIVSAVRPNRTWRGRSYDHSG